jgi:hypothetical protein
MCWRPTSRTSRSTRWPARWSPVAAGRGYDAWATDATLARALRRGSELTMPQLVQALIDDGYGAGGAKHIVRTAPVLRRMGYNRYRLRRG